jgi:hypothetical protein
MLTDEPFQVEFIPRIQQLTSAILNPFFKLDRETKNKSEPITQFFSKLIAGNRNESKSLRV